MKELKEEDLKFSEDENTLTIEYKTFIAKEGGCDNCDVEDICLHRCDGLFLRCFSRFRKDRREIAWKLKNKQS